MCQEQSRQKSLPLGVYAGRGHTNYTGSIIQQYDYLLGGVRAVERREQRQGAGDTGGGGRMLQIEPSGSVSQFPRSRSEGDEPVSQWGSGGREF